MDLPSDMPAAILQKPVEFKTLLVLLEVLCDSRAVIAGTRHTGQFLPARSVERV